MQGDGLDLRISYGRSILIAAEDLAVTA